MLTGRFNSEKVVLPVTFETCNISAFLLTLSTFLIRFDTFFIENIAPSFYGSKLHQWKIKIAIVQNKGSKNDFNIIKRVSITHFSYMEFKTCYPKSIYLSQPKILWSWPKTILDPLKDRSHVHIMIVTYKSDPVLVGCSQGYPIQGW